MTLRSRQRTIALCLLAVCVWLLAACGGRFRTVNEVDDDGGAPSAGRAGAASGGRAGAPGAGAPGAGAPGGGTPSAGAPGAGAPGGGGCGNVDCPFIKCAAGYAPVVLPGKCCAVCQQTCQEVACPAVACGPGTHPEVPADACCPVCIDDAGYACTKGKAQYQEQRAQFLDKYSHGCNTPGECTVIAPVNQCEAGCQYEALWVGAANYFNDNLSNLASTVCTTCDMQPTPPCFAPTQPVCINHQCVLAVF